MPVLRVATLNLRNREARWQERRHLLVEQLLETAPDLVSLQEISLPIRQGHWLRQQLNLRISGSEKAPYRLFQQRKKHWLKGYYEGIGILTKLPVIYRDAVGLGYGGRVALRLNVELPTRQTLDFVAVHLHPTAADRQARQEQAMQLVAWLNGRRRVPRQMIAGDFNEVPAGLAIAYMKQSYRSAYAEVHGHEPLATFPTALIPTDGWAGCLDYIFVSTAVPPIRHAQLFCTRHAPDDDTLYPSDHVGVLATIDL